MLTIIWCLYNETKRYADAIESFTRALHLTPITPIHFMSLVCLSMLGRDEDAVNGFIVIGLKPDSSAAYNNLGVSYCNLRQLKRQRII
jgi:tetratricopeptide (TPR) repeat protein